MIDLEILAEFKNETQQIISDLEKILEEIEDAEDEFPEKKVEEFAQMIDRIMGAANTFSQMSENNQTFVFIGKLAGLGKAIGYKAAQLKLRDLMPLFTSFLADTIEMIGELVRVCEDDLKAKTISNQYGPVLHKRLVWLGNKVNEFAQSNQSTQLSGQIQVDALLKSFGIT